jgi:tripartite-type tricarboxylate transporter receptor subunit TctC
MRPIISRSFIKKSFSNRSFFKVTAFLLAAGALPATTHADQYPGGRPIEMTVMFGAGSAADVTARYLADGIAKLLGVPVPVVNRTGAAGQ